MDPSKKTRLAENIKNLKSMQHQQSYEIETERFNSDAANEWTPTLINQMRSLIANYVSSPEYLQELKKDSVLTVRRLLNYHEWIEHCTEPRTRFLPWYLDGKTGQNVLSLFDANVPAPVTSNLKELENLRKFVTEMKTKQLTDAEKIDRVLKQTWERIDMYKGEERLIAFEPVVVGRTVLVPFSFIEDHIKDLICLVDPEGLLAVRGPTSSSLSYVLHEKKS